MIARKTPAFGITAAAILAAAVARSMAEETATRLPMGALAHATAVLLATAVAWPVNDEAATALGTQGHATEVMECATHCQVLEIRQVDETGDPGFQAVVAPDDTVLHRRVALGTDAIAEIVVSEQPSWLRTEPDPLVPRTWRLLCHVSLIDPSELSFHIHADSARCVLG